MGFDLYRNEDQYGSRNNAGLYAGYGHGEVDVEHNLLGLTFKGGEDKLDAFSRRRLLDPFRRRATGTSTAFCRRPGTTST